MDKIVIGLNIIVDLIDTNQNIDENQITVFLLQSGFDDYEIRQIMSLLDFNTTDNQFVQRIFSEYEKKKLTVKSIFFLQRLLLSGVLDVVTVEEIISRVLTLDANKINVETVKEITLGFIFEKHDFFGESLDLSEGYIN